MKELKGSEFLLDGYLTLGEPKKMAIGGCSYILKRYQGNHADEYTLKKDNKVCLFKNGIIKMIFKEGEEETPIGEFTRFNNGCVAFVQSFDDIYDHHHFNRIVNHVRGERLEIYLYESDHLIYHGEFNEKREREGWGIEHDAETGAMLLEGI